MSIKVDLKGLPGLLGTIENRIYEAANNAGLDAEAGVTHRAMDRRVDNTYKSKPEYTYVDEKGRKRKRKWNRSHNFQKGVKVEREPGARRVGMTGAAAQPITNYEGGYAEKLTTLPVSKDGKSRRNNFAEDTERITRPQRGKAFEQAVRNEIHRLVG